MKKTTNAPISFNKLIGSLKKAIKDITNWENNQFSDDPMEDYVFNTETLPEIKQTIQNVLETLQEQQAEIKAKQRDLDGRCHFCGKVNDRCFCEKGE